MLHRLTHRQLECFRAVIETGTVTAAANLLNTSQPSVSRMIAELEHASGFALFSRVGRKIVPTTEAIALHEEVERSFVGLSEIARVIEDIRDFRTGSLTIAGMPALALKFLPDVMTEFIAAEPGVTVSLRARSSKAVLQHLGSQQFDLGFASIDADHPGVTRRPIRIDSMRAVLPPGHELAQKSRLAPDDFHDRPFVALGQEIVTRSETDAFLAAAGARPRIVAEAQLSASICELVAGGVGLAIVEPVTAAIFARAGRVNSRPLTPEQPFRYDLLTPTTRAPSRPATRFLEFVEARFTALLEP